MYGKFGIDSEVLEFGEYILKSLNDRFAEADAVAEYNQLKVIRAMQECGVSEACLSGTTGYGYNDIGRDRLEEVYAKVFGTEDALVRNMMSCGTHALAIALWSSLRPGDELLSLSGKPYDTLEKVIGIRKSRGSLAEYGITYRQADLLPSGDFDHDAIKALINENTKVAAIQRSRGYELRPSIPVGKIGEVIAFVKKIKPDIICMVDNCYGEFVEKTEPGQYGADLVVGSLIKNPGGGIAPMGGYIAGRKDCVEACAVRMTSPGLGREVGASLDINRSFYHGLFLAPVVTASALKGALFASAAYEACGFEAYPKASEMRTDIIQAVTLKSAEALEAFCAGIQKAAPVDSFVEPVPAPMPGYESEVIMAAGAFISGSSIELSADGPLREPYNVYFQGGLTWPSAKLGILMTLQELKNKDLLLIPEFK